MKIILAVVMAFITILFANTVLEGKDMKSIYEIQVKTILGEETNLSEYQGKVMLIFNAASKCGFTKHYKGLQELYSKYKDRGLVVLGFPCNQFGGQEPGTEEEILEFCQTNYNITFPMYSKIEVNGDNTHPLFSHLKSEGRGEDEGEIKWNFTKFLVSKDGKSILRYGTRTEPKDLSEDIEKLLSE